MTSTARTETGTLSLATITQSAPSAALTDTAIRGNNEKRPSQSLLDFENDLKRLQTKISNMQTPDEAKALQDNGIVASLQQRAAALQSSVTDDSYRELTASLNSLSVGLDDYLTDYREKSANARKKALLYDLQSAFYNIPNHLIVQPVRAVLDAVGVSDSSPVKGIFNNMSASAEAANRREAENDAYLTPFETGLGNGIQMVLEAVPQLVLARYTGGETLAQAAGRLSANAAVSTTAQSLATAAKQATTRLFSNPSFWASAIPAAADTYLDAKESGAALAERSLASVVSGLLNGTIEVGVVGTDGGMQSFVQSLDKATVSNRQKQLLTQYVAAAMEEGLEEAEQNIATALVGKAVYRPDAPVFSLQDEQAVLNPLREAKSYLAGAAVSAVVTAPGTVRRSVALHRQAAPSSETPTAALSPAAVLPQTDSVSTAVSPAVVPVATTANTAPAEVLSVAAEPARSSWNTATAEPTVVNTSPAAVPSQTVAEKAATPDTETRIGSVPSAQDIALQSMSPAQRQQLYRRLEQRTGVAIVEDAGLSTDGEYRHATATETAVIYIQPHQATPMTVIKHELTHHLEQSTLLYQDFANYAWESRTFEQWLARRGTTRTALMQELAARYAARGTVLDTEIDGAAEREMLATFAAEELFTSETSLRELGRARPSLLERLRRWLSDIVRCFRGTPLNREVQRMEALFNTALRATENTPATATGRPLTAAQPAVQYYMAPTETSPSAFADSVQQSPMLSDETKALAAGSPTLSSYRAQSNRDALTVARTVLTQDGEAAVQALLKKDAAHFTANDVALGLEAVRQYEAQQQHEQSLAVLEKLREVATAGGQTLQLFSLLGRLTPDGMVLYAGRELSRAGDALGRGRSRRWQEAHRDCFVLTEADADYIRRRTVQANKLPEGRDRNIRLAEISDRLQRKLPPEKGQAFKTWQRTAMLLNPKTQLRNVLGNVTMFGAFLGSDAVGSVIDRALSAKTGIRTTAAFRPSSLRGLKNGLFASYNDFFRHVNTRATQANRFTLDTQGGENYNTHHTGVAAAPRNTLSRALNALDRFNSFLLDAGDRPFYEMWFLNSLNGQMQANHLTAPTDEMIEIATQEALQRTWQDSNALTRVLSDVKQGLNRLTGQSLTGYGLGDVLIKFVKTPANLTKATLEFSPVGFAKAITVDAARFTSAVRNGTVTAKQQRAFVRNLANGMVGSLLTAFAAGLAHAGLLTGKQNDDRDVAALERTLFGTQPYSFRVGNTTFTYDWAQPVSTTLAIMADYCQSQETSALTGERRSAAEAVTEALRIGGQTLYNQSFMQSLYQFFSSDDLVTGVINAVLSDLTAPIPQLLSQTASVFDPTVRTSYEYDNEVQTAVNQLLYKLPGARNTLTPSVDVLGRERMQADNPLQRAFRSYISPANIAAGTESTAGREMYRLYQSTGRAEAVAPSAPNYLITATGYQPLTATQKAEYQTVTGQIAVQSVSALLQNSAYLALSDDNRVRLLTSVYQYATQTARQQVLGLPPNDGVAKAMRAAEVGLPPEQYYLLRQLADADGNGRVSQQEARTVLDSSDLTATQKSVLWQSFNSGWKYNPYQSQHRYY